MSTRRFVATSYILQWESDDGALRVRGAEKSRQYCEAWHRLRRVFSDPYVIVLEDRVIDGEQRLHAIGYVEGILVVVHTVREEVSTPLFGSFRRA